MNTMDVKGLKINFQKLDLDEKLFFLGEMVSLFEKKEQENGIRYDEAEKNQKLSLLKGAVELRQLIYILRDQLFIISRKPYDEGNAVWIALKNCIAATESQQNYQ
ncbi:hypothetical protein [Aeromonas salmonicida]|uniref:hypothetical protein n=1 Tax=Aeromonas salmonicida TaxID=645 RepID=UPI003D1984F8